LPEEEFQLPLGQFMFCRRLIRIMCSIVVFVLASQIDLLMVFALLNSAIPTNAELVSFLVSPFTCSALPASRIREPERFVRDVSTAIFGDVILNSPADTSNAWASHIEETILRKMDIRAIIGFSVRENQANIP
jgi:hypothetical protein